MEEFLISSAKEARIDMRFYNLSSDPKELHHQISRVNPPEGYFRLLRDLINSKSKRILALSDLLRKLSD